MQVVLIVANSADPDEMQHYAAFHLGVHCLPMYPIRGFPIYKGLIFSKIKKYIKKNCRLLLRGDCGF